MLTWWVLLQHDHQLHHAAERRADSTSKHRWFSGVVWQGLRTTFGGIKWGKMSVRAVATHHKAAFDFRKRKGTDVQHGRGTCNW